MKRKGSNRKGRQALATLEGRAHVAKRKQQVETALEDSIKDNLADRVIDNFVGELAALPFEARFKFALGVIRGTGEDLAAEIEELAKKMHNIQGALPFEEIGDQARDILRGRARGMFAAAGIEE